MDLTMVDALAILLEQLILHGDNDIEKRRKLLEILLGVTELQDMHFRRLHRLQLKWPLMFEALSQQFSAILAAPNYPLNLYQGL